MIHTQLFFHVNYASSNAYHKYPCKRKAVKFLSKQGKLYPRVLIQREVSEHIRGKIHATDT